MTNWQYLADLASGRAEFDAEKVMDCADELRTTRETNQVFRERLADIVDAVRKRTVGMKTYGGGKR